MISNLEIEKKMNLLLKYVSDALEECEEAENYAEFKQAKANYNRSMVDLMNFYDFLNSLIDNINYTTECFDKEFDAIERRFISQK